MGAISEIFKDNTATAFVHGVTDADGTFQNDATVTLESLVDEATSVAVTGVTVPLSLGYIASSDGEYEGNISATAGITVGTMYLGTFKVVLSGGEIGEWQERMKCKQRKG